MILQFVVKLFAPFRSGKRSGRTPFARRFATLEPLRLEDRTMLSTLLGPTLNTFAVLGGSTVVNTGPSVINGNLGVNPGTSVTGFPPGTVVAPGAIHAGDAVALEAHSELNTAYNTLAGLPSNSNLTGQDLGGLTLTPGVYKFSSSAQLTGTLTLDGQGSPNAVFVIQIGSTLTAANNSAVVLINGAQDDEVYWQVGSSATIGGDTTFAGNIVAFASVTLSTGATLENGRALAENGAVTLDSNMVSIATGSISGEKFNDVNGDGILQAGEPGLAGVTIFLDTNNNGVLDAGEISTTTDANGNYTFTDLQPGSFTVREVIPAGMVQTSPLAPPVTVTSGQNVTGVNLGDFKLVSISGTAFNDLNGNGVRDPGDTGLAGVTVFLDTNHDGVLDNGEVSTTTDANGNYSFANLTPGTYTVREVQTVGTTRTTANPANITVSSGANTSGVNFGNFTLISISGSAFQDTNGDGVRDNGEKGLPGVTVFLDTNNNGILDVGERRTTTDINGNYTFANVGPGTYHVREVAQPGLIQMTNNPAAINATSGINVTERPFGISRAAALVSSSKLTLTGQNMAAAIMAQQTQFVANLFETLLGRAPDLAGLRKYVRLLQAGFSTQQVAAMFRSDYHV